MNRAAARTGRLRRTAALAGVVVGVLMVGFLTPATSASAAAMPFVRGGRTEPTYSFQKAVREQIHVETTLDSDSDGRKDQVVVDVVRPSEAAKAGTKVPVILEASPYYECCGRGNEDQKKTYAADGSVAGMPLAYDNYFVPRGYAFAAVDLSGTNKSEGCPDVGGPAEVLGARAVVDWLNGRAKGFRKDGSPAKADWTTGKVGMIGKSWDGTIANGVAATGVRGLATIVPIGGISSWYDYERFDGQRRYKDYHAYLAALVDGRPKGVCAAKMAADATASDDKTGNYNSFWAARNYRPDVSKVRASVFVVHGANDTNVTTRQFAAWWSALGKRGVPRKLWLSQTGHVDPFDFRRKEWVDTLHAWFDQWLHGLPNAKTLGPAVSVQRQSGEWVNELSWPAVRGAGATLGLGAGDGKGAGTIGVRPGKGVRTFTEDPKLTEEAAVAVPNENRNGRISFLSGKMPRDVRLSGEASVTLRIKVDKPTVALTTRLVDYGSQRRVDYQSKGSGIHDLTTKSCWGQSTATDSACYLDTAPDYVTSSVDVLARGWKDAAHYQSVSKETPLLPNRWYTVKVQSQPYDAIIRAGHVLGLMVTGTEGNDDRMDPRPTGATVQVDLAASRLTLPITDARLVPSIPYPPSLGKVAPHQAPAPEKVRREFR